MKERIIVGKPMPPEHKAHYYTSSGMSGYEDHNFPAFQKVADNLRGQGFIVISPHENDRGDTSKSWEYYMRQDLKHVCNSDAVVVFGNWKESKGARIEVFVAHLLKMPIYLYPDIYKTIPQEDINEAIQRAAADFIKVMQEPELPHEEAYRLINKDRNNSYGDPEDDFGRTATMWTAFLSPRLKDNAIIASEDVPYLMVMLKLSREAHKKKRDSFVDVFGYLFCLEKIMKKKGIL